MGVFDFGVGAAFWLTVFSMLLCVGYGAWRWNKDDDTAVDVALQSWASEEDAIEGDL
ncbi:hypothetical protein JWV37_07095 [Sulfurospirillum sp. T05]|uniref:CcoQ/FixQ family Cbb3-type cytochrome c oxidase assembly chaperone n=1 Tax=Sulfurospirillum tamanense TaxID=2813362 RepID=A0ABS2WS92_9BACT|nr:symporter small accessory protein [Sulfurospirillum tamanensis]MBN2964541.1 hypothetical protein [Sulfurospirillum tamanensis]